MTRSNVSFIPILFAAGAAFCTTAFAQSVPNAGTSLRELEKPDFRAPPPPPGLPSLQQAPDIAEPPAEAMDGEKFLVKSISISGETSIPTEELSALLLPWVGRELGIAELRQAAARISQHYRDMGYLLARAYVPAQKPDDGAVTIAVLEGKLSALHLKNSSKISEERLHAITGRLAVGDAVRSDRLERSLLLLKALPGVDGVNAVLQPGETVGSTELLVDVLGGPFITGSAEADNYGNSYTGSFRLGSTIYLNNPAGIGDQISMRLQASTHKLYYGRLAYRVPIGSNGLSGGLSYTASSYHLGRQYEVLDANGTTQGIGAFVDYPFRLTPTLVISGMLAAEQKQLRDSIDAFGLENSKSTQTLSATVTANGTTDKSAWSGSASFTSGWLKIKTPSSLEMDDASARTNGHYGKLSYSAAARYRLSGPWSLFGALSGQFASRNLDSSEKFSLGGAEGVRAYPQGEGVGDEGLLTTAELRYLLDPRAWGQVELGGFIDYGAVTVSRNPYAAGPNHRHLSAIGMSMLWGLPDKWQVRASVARRLGSEPAQSDSDSTVRAWLQALKGF
jgi:hemolysin activation/secretion protein